MLSSRVIRSFNELTSRHAEWDQLLDRCGNRNPFLTRQWITLWWRYYGRDRTPVPVILEDETGRLAGAAFFYLGRRSFRWPGWLSWRELRLIGYSEEMESDYLRFVHEPDRFEESWQGILSALRAISDEWDLLLLTNVLCSEDELALLSRTLRAQSWLCGVQHRTMHDCPEIRLPGTYDEYLSGLKSKFRQEVRRLRRRLAKRHSVCFRRVGADGVELDDLLEPALKLHRKWAATRAYYRQGRLEAFQRFMAEAARMMHRHGWLHMAVLEVDGEPAGAVFNFAYQGAIYGFQKATDPRYAADGIDNVLLGFSIEDAIGMGMKRYDFMQGAEMYKSRWTNLTKSNWILSCRRRTLRGRLHLGISAARRILRGDG